MQPKMEIRSSFLYLRTTRASLINGKLELLLGMKATSKVFI
jgi:hypothetical protein